MSEHKEIKQDIKNVEYAVTSGTGDATINSINHRQNHSGFADNVAGHKIATVNNYFQSEKKLINLNNLSNISVQNIGNKRDQYEELLCKIAYWSPSKNQTPDDLYEDCQKLDNELKNSENKLRYYVLCLKYYLLLKAGKVYREQKKWKNYQSMGPLIHLMRKNRENAPIARWILARMYFSEAENHQNQEKKTFLTKAYNLISEIQEEITVDTDILLPGIKSEAPEENLQMLLGEDPTTKIVPIPHRYIATYSLSLFGIDSMLGNKDKLQNHLCKAEQHCKQSIDRFGNNEIYLSTNIHLTKATLDTLRICNRIDSKKIIHSVVEDFYKLEDKIEQAQNNAIFSKYKALSWLVGIYAGLSALYMSEGSKLYDMYLIKYYEAAVELFKISSGQVDFFSLEPIFKLPFKHELARIDFINELKKSNKS